MIVSSEPDSGVRMTSVLLLVECGSVLAVMTNVSSIMWHYILVYSANTDTSKPHQTLRPRKVRNAPTLSESLCVGSHTVACQYPSVKHFICQILPVRCQKCQISAPGSTGPTGYEQP